MFRHTAVYGGVYAIGDVAFCLGFAIGKLDAVCTIEKGYIIEGLASCLQEYQYLKYASSKVIPTNLLGMYWE